MRVVLLTGSELRHDFVRKKLATAFGITLIRSYCEGTEKSLQTHLNTEKTASPLQKTHLEQRFFSEQQFFGDFVKSTPDHLSHPIKLPKGDINQPEYVKEITNLQPDLLVAFGCSLIKPPLIQVFKNRFLNVHLGLSPYYRGSGTNFWPLVNNEPEYVGATFMYIDEGVDTGEIIHQIRARFFLGDAPHSIGNRLIEDMVQVYIKIIQNFNKLKPIKNLPPCKNGRLYKKKDFTPESVQQLYINFEDGLIARYLQEKEEREKKVPMITNPFLKQL